MDEHALRELIGRVQRGQLSRRQFTRMMVGFGLTAPRAAGMLASAGVATAQPAATAPAATAPAATAPVPTKRGGGGDLRVLMWDAPTLLHPHFGRGLRDVTAARLFYEPLAAPTPDGTFAPVLASEIPSLKNGTLYKDGTWVTWRLKKDVVWQGSAPFTA